MNCYYCDARPVHKDAQGFVYVHKSECPILEIEVNKMVEKCTCFLRGSSMSCAECEA